MTRLPALFISLLALPWLTVAQAPREAPAALTLASPISDHMVLQQGKKTSVWGTAKPGADVTVEFAGQSVTATADDDGNWSTTLAPLETSAEGRILSATTKSDKNIEVQAVKDVLVGEVWMCSGQSNMGWTLSRSHDGEEAAKAADYPNVRLFRTPTRTADTVQRDIPGAKWEVCTPKTAPAFSAVGFYFGRELHKALGPDTPIGLINTAWGGKPTEAFSSRETLANTPSAKDLLAEWDAKQERYDPETAKANYDKALATWKTRVEDIKAKAKEEDKKPGRLPRKPSEPTAPNRIPNCPSAIYHQMVAPWTHYAIRGAIWYQGESNRPRAQQYETLFPAMITDWRKQWNDDFPFYLVQLANYHAPFTDPGLPDAWAELQNAQTLTLNKLPQTGIAIINDIGEADDIHPGNKTDVGKRLSRWALANEYGKDMTPISGPLYKSHTTHGATVTVYFDHVGDGLKSRDGEPLQRFEIAGADQVFHWADATISKDGNSVIVTSDKVAEPASVRYAWAANPEGANLGNSADLPASLFRTDAWPLATDGINTLAAASKLRTPNLIRRQNDRLEKGGWTVLFNGYNLDGWQNPYDWGESNVVNGEIHLTANKKFFLATKETFSNFHFQAEINLPEGKANSGLMFRAHLKPNKVFGYQAECDGSDRRWSGGLYDEGRRGWIWPHKGTKAGFDHFAKDNVKNALKRTDWNKYDIICKGNSIQIRVNGVTTANIKDDTDAEGYFALQHHGEKGQTYKFRNVMVKELK